MSAWIAAVLTVLIAAVTVALTPTQAKAIATAVPLGTADSFAVLAGSAVTNTGPSVVNGDLGVSPGSSITGFTGPPNGTVNGVIHQTDAVAAQAQVDLTTAYDDAAGQPEDVDITDVDLGGQSLGPGVYHADSGIQLTGQLTLDAAGDPNAVWVFQAESTLITAPNSSVLLVDGASPCNVFWQVGSSATLDTNTTFVGNILALTQIALNDAATIQGRALARNAAVTMINNVITRPNCAGGTTGGTTTTTGGTTGETTTTGGTTGETTTTGGTTGETTTTGGTTGETTTT
ncbi:ice-binding family protein, partial [Streptomyces sp. NPDC002889]|uniref:ice-binding family protein n=1 Tax=Streptomyces sp. NPDC002889 TaxID=3364669 RepID=UPI0036ABEAB8